MSSNVWVVIGSVNGLSPVQHQANTSASSDLFSLGTLRTNFNEISIDAQAFSFQKIPEITNLLWFKMLSLLIIFIIILTHGNNMNSERPWPHWLPKPLEHYLNGVVCWVECSSINSWNGRLPISCFCVGKDGHMAAHAIQNGRCLFGLRTHLDIYVYTPCI